MSPISAVILLGFAVAYGSEILECPPSNFPKHVETKIESDEHPITGEVSQLCKAIPKDPNEVVDIANYAAENAKTKIVVRGKRHLTRRRRSLDGKSILLVSAMEHLNKIKVNKAQSAVHFQSGATLGELLSSINEHSLGLFSVPNVHNVTMGGVLAATGGHGETDHGSSGTISNLIAELNFIGYNPSSGKYELMTLSRNSSAVELSPLLGGHEGRVFVVSATIYASPEAHGLKHVDTSEGFRYMHSITVLSSAEKMDPIKEKISEFYKEKYESKCGQLSLRITPVDSHELGAPLLSKAKVDDKHPEYNKVLWVEVLTPKIQDPNSGCENRALDELEKLVEKEFKDVAIVRGNEHNEHHEEAQRAFRKYDPKGIF